MSSRPPRSGRPHADAAVALGRGDALGALGLVGRLDDARALLLRGVAHHLPEGYDLESRPGDEGWTVYRARDTQSGQILTMWAVAEGSTDVDLME